MCVVAIGNYAAPQHNGRSVIFDGIATSNDGEGRNPTVIEASAEVGLVVGDVDLDRLRAYRKREVWGPNFRQPDLYGPLARRIPLEPDSQPS
jgi:predicted amidohydrolase